MMGLLGDQIISIWWFTLLERLNQLIARDVFLKRHIDFNRFGLKSANIYYFVYLFVLL